MEKLFYKKVNKKFIQLANTEKLFRVNIDTDTLWKTYLKSFSNDGIWRDPESSIHNCNTCHRFIKRYSNVVTLDSNANIITMFDVTDCGKYQQTADALSNLLKQAEIKDVFFESLSELRNIQYDACKPNQSKYRLGVQSNHKMYTQEEADKFGKVEPNKVYTFVHFYIDLPKKFVTTNVSKESKIGKFRDKTHLLRRAVEEISIDTYLLVQDLISQGSLLNAESYLSILKQMIAIKKDYDKVTINKSNWIWNTAYNLKGSITGFKNTLIGTLCSELTEGKELNKACLDWNKRADPANYMKVKVPIIESQKKLAQKFIEDNNYLESFNRRFAVLEDIKTSEIYHMNVSKEGIKSISLFDKVETKSSQHKRNEFKNIEKVSIKKFMKDILPTCSQVELYLDNKHVNNMVTLTTSQSEKVKPLFMWNNPFSWTYKGNLAGKSLLKQAVKTQGGNVNGILRFSIMWAEGMIDNSDLDAHCIEPNKSEIYYNKKKSTTGGVLDIDVVHPQQHKQSNDVTSAVENITYSSTDKMITGTYTFFVVQFTGRKSQGFSAEIEINGQIYQYKYNKRVTKPVSVAKVTYHGNNTFTIEHLLPAEELTTNIYGLETKKFHKVNLICLSPNYWNNKIGNKHYFFMLDKCKTTEAIRSFHNENLNEELKKHRKVLDILGEVTKLQPANKQLSGVGFNATIRDNVILKLSGNFKRVIKIEF